MTPRISATVFVLSIIALCSNVLLAQETNTIVFCTLYDKYTLPEGKLALACVRLLGNVSVEAFQNEHSLDVDGIVGVKTWEKVLHLLQRKKIQIRDASASPIIIKTSAVGRRVCFELCNRTPNYLLVQGYSLRGAGAATNRVSIPISAKFSGADGEKRFNGWDSTTWEINLPSQIAPFSGLKALKSWRHAGKGSTEIRVSMVVVENGNRIFPILGEPLLLDEHIVFAE